MQEDSFLTNVDTDVIYPQIKNKPSSVYSFLLVTGYLTVHWLDMQTDGTYMCQVRVPNKEIALVYSKEILDNLETVLPQSVAVTVQEALYTGNVPVLQSSLELFLCQAISYFDTAQEAFYHGLVLGLCALLNRQYRVVSNRESENGRPDIMLIPREKRLPGIVIELKACRSGDEAQLDRLAKEAVKQIKERGYDAGMKASGVNMVLKYGVAFCGKRVKAARE